MELEKKFSWTLDEIVTLNKLKIKAITKLPWEKLDAWAFFGHYLVSPALHPGFSGLWRSPPDLSSTPKLGFFFFFFFECLGIKLFLRNPSHSQLGYLWLPTPQCAVPMWLTGHYAGHWSPGTSHPNPYLGKWRISLGMIGILSMCLRPHT